MTLHSGSLSRSVIIVTGISPDDGLLPLQFALYQNYPNPFNPSTTVKYDLPAATYVTLRVFDILGQQVSTLVDEEKLAGEHRVTVTMANLASGVYFYRLQTRDHIQTRKLVLLK